MSKSANYLPALDGLRALAVFPVMFLHLGYGVFSGGVFGVDLFFVLSGYLITTLLLREYDKAGDISLKKFYVRRALRLLPALLFTIVLTVPFWDMATKDWQQTGDCSSWVLPAVAVLFYCANFFPHLWLGTFCVCWSLAVEEHFYFFWPTFLKVTLKKMSLKKLIWLSIVLIFAVGMLRFYIYRYWPQIDSFYCTFTRIDTIIIGAVFAIVLRAFPRESNKFLDVCWKWRLPEVLLVAWLLICAFDYGKDPWLYFGGLDLIAIGIAIIIACVVQPQAKEMILVRFLSSPPLVWIGVRSYGIYLFHLVIFRSLEFLRVRHDMLNLLAVTGLRFFLTFFVAAISYKFVEQPFLKWKEKFSTAPAEPTGSTA